MSQENKLTKILVNEWSPKGEYLISDRGIKRTMAHIVGKIKEAKPAEYTILTNVFLDEFKDPQPMEPHEIRMWDVHIAELRQRVLTDSKQLDMFSMDCMFDQTDMVITQGQPQFFTDNIGAFFTRPTLGAKYEKGMLGARLSIGIYVQDNSGNWVVRQDVIDTQKLQMYHPMTADLFISNRFVDSNRLRTFAVYSNMLAIEADVKTIDEIEIPKTEDDTYIRLFFWQLNKFTGLA